MSDAMFSANRERHAGNLDAAAASYKQALQAHPAEARHPLGVVLSALGRTAEAETYLREALEIAPDFAEARHSLALLLLSVGRYAEAWPLYEARRQIPALKTPAPNLSLPEWTGEDLAGKRILVFGEQGFGDQIMFGRFLMSLQDLGAEPIYACAPALNRLFPNSVSNVGKQSIKGRPDYWILVGSLPLVLGVTLENLPQPVNFGIKSRAGNGLGVMAAGSPIHGRDALRSLQGADRDALLAEGLDLSPEATGAADFLETAELIAELALVVTVDTAVAHLAASMAKPTWLLLQNQYVDWRWLRDRADSPWYPSVTLFRQSAVGDWTSILAAMRRHLDDLSHGAPPSSAEINLRR